MRRITAALSLCAMAWVTPAAHAASSYRVEHLTGATATFGVGTVADGNRLASSVRFLRSEAVAGSGDEEQASTIGMCVSISSHYGPPGVAGGSESMWSESGCASVEPSPGPLRVAVTIPTVIKIREDGLLSNDVVEERASSVTLDLTWTPRVVSAQDLQVCQPQNPGNGYVAGSINTTAVVHVDEWGQGLPGTVADAAGSITSAVQGDLYQPPPPPVTSGFRGGSPRACFVEGYVVTATVEAAAP